tara:strand:- start:1143 stop:1430 length:288 start_codon:yes stop_codon:yes gene_type:complete
MIHLGACDDDESSRRRRFVAAIKAASLMSLNAELAPPRRERTISKEPSLATAMDIIQLFEIFFGEYLDPKKKVESEQPIVIDAKKKKPPRRSEGA